MKVLIPSDNRDFVAEMAGAYQEAGCEVVTGTFNFELGSADFDFVHYQWPEELSDGSRRREAAAGTNIKKATMVGREMSDHCYGP